MSHVLLIDDNSDIRSMLRIFLESEGHRVVEAANAVIALELANKAQPDAIFVDVDMPQMTGAQFLVQLRQHPTLALTPATFVTGHPDRVQVFARHGIAEAEVIAKPFKMEQIRRALERMLNASSNEMYKRWGQHS